MLDDDAILDSVTARRFAIVKNLYRSIDGFNISQKERSRLFNDDQSLTYGEVDYLPFIQMLQGYILCSYYTFYISKVLCFLIRTHFISFFIDSGARDGHIFYDLGSGTGRAVVSAGLSGISFLKCIGIEILPALCECSQNVVESVKKAVDVETRNSSYTSKLLDITLPILSIVEGDLLTEDWSEADVIFVRFFVSSCSIVIYNIRFHINPIIPDFFSLLFRRYG